MEIPVEINRSQVCGCGWYICIVLSEDESDFIYLSPDGKWRNICLGSFKTKEDAERALSVWHHETNLKRNRVC